MLRHVVEDTVVSNIQQTGIQVSGAAGTAIGIALVREKIVSLTDVVQALRDTVVVTVNGEGGHPQADQMARSGPQAARCALADVFAEALRERDDAASEEQLAQAREKAFRAPLLMLAVVRTGSLNSEIPPHERLLSAGCAIQNMLLMATAMGFGSALTSGKAMQSVALRTDKPLDIDKLSAFMNQLLEEHGKQLLRYKGVLNIAGEPDAEGERRFPPIGRSSVPSGSCQPTDT